MHCFDLKTVIIAKIKKGKYWRSIRSMGSIFRWNTKLLVKPSTKTNFLLNLSKTNLAFFKESSVQQFLWLPLSDSTWVIMWMTNSNKSLKLFSLSRLCGIFWFFFLFVIRAFPATIISRNRKKNTVISPSE